MSPNAHQSGATEPGPPPEAETARPAARRHTVEAGAGDRGRVDAFLARRIDGLSRSRLKALIAAGAVSADGETIKEPSEAVKPGRRYVVAVPEPAPAVPQAQEIALEILFEDDDLIVIDKPAGLVVHPAPGNPDRTLVNALIHHCGAGLTGIGGVRRPGIVHRLDKDTSGVMVCAKSARAHAGLVEQFQAHTIDRAYVALVRGVPKPQRGRIEGAIGRNPRNRKKMAVVRRGGRPAVTRYRVLRTFGEAASEVECRLETGRTHQIRVHMASIGHPVLGDPLYGGRAARRGLGGLAVPRQALHAVLLGFTHPATGERLTFEATIPTYFNELITKLEGIKN